MHLFQWIILFFFYGFICVTVEAIIGIPATWVFWGIPVVCIIGIISFVIGFSAKEKENPTSSPVEKIPGVSDDALKKESLSLLKKFDDGSESGEVISSRLAKYVMRPLPEYIVDNRPYDLEYLYLGLRCKGDLERIKLCFSAALLNDKWIDFRQKQKIEGALSRFISSISDLVADSDIDYLAKEHIGSLLKLEPRNFPTQFSLINVLAIPKDSFLEKMVYEKAVYFMDNNVVKAEFSIAELRAEAERLSALVGGKVVQRYLESSLNRSRLNANKSMKKLLDKENINASDCKNALRWASAYCYSDSIHHISYAEEFAKKTIEKASESKQTKPLIEALIRLNDFIELPKGIADKEKARLMQQPLIELEEVVELLEHAPDFSSYEIYVRIL
ncbi:hypothetical protein OAD24_15090, partial [Pseudomonadales bacterium]|nr:hypothetical protein [Pseudomonadales bacterium]